MRGEENCAATKASFRGVAPGGSKDTFSDKEILLMIMTKKVDDNGDCWHLHASADIILYRLKHSPPPVWFSL